MVDQIGAAYDPVVNSLMQQQQAVRRAAGRNADEVRGWYGQVVDHLGRAGQRDKAINAAAVGSMQDATQAIVASLGGAANPGAGVVGAAGAQAVGTLGALWSAQEQYNQDMAPLLQGEGAAVMALTEDMITFVADKVLGSRTLTYQGHQIDLQTPWPRIELKEAVLEMSGIDIDAHPTASGLLAEMRARGLQPGPEPHARQADRLLAK